MSQSASPAPFGPAPNFPMTFGQILDRTYRLMRTHFILLVGIAAIPSTLLFLFIGLLETVIWIPMIQQWPKQPSPDAMQRYFTPAVFIPAFVVFSLLSLVIFSVYLAAASYASTQADSGVKVTIREAYALACRRFGRYLWLMVLVYLYIYVPIAAAAALIGLAVLLLHYVGGVGAGPVSMFFLVLLLVLLYLGILVYSILIMLRFSLAYPASVVEKLSAWASLQRSAKLTQGARGRIFLVVLVIYAILYASVLLIEVVAMLFAVIGVVGAIALHAHLSPPWSYIGAGLLGICAFVVMVLFTSLIYAALMAALAVLYHDQRLRKNGPLPPPAPAAGMA